MHCITEHLLNILIQRHRCSHKSIMMYALYAVKMLICGDCECLPRCADVGSDTARRHYYGLAVSQGIDLVVRSEDAEDAEKILDMDVTEGDDPTKTDT